MEFKSLYFLITGPGEAMNIALEEVQRERETREKTFALLKGLGVKHYRAFHDGQIACVQFEGEVPQHFTRFSKRVGDRHWWRPMKKSPWFEKFYSARREKSVASIIHERLGYDHCVSYEKGGEKGCTIVGHPFAGCGIAWFNPEGPFLLYIPDATYHARRRMAEGYTVENVNMDPQYEGCKRITKDEWDLLVLQNKIARGDAE